MKDSLRLNADPELHPRDYALLNLHESGETGYLWIQRGDQTAGYPLHAHEIDALRKALNRHHRRNKIAGNR